jgi:hypothetical protein
VSDDVPVAKRGGRPQKPAGERLVPLPLRVTEAQADEIYRRAIRSGKTTGEYLRGVLSKVLNE